MRTQSRFAISLSSLALVFAGGCGSNLSPIAASPALAGNWSFQSATAPANASQIANLGGALVVSSSGAISGTLHTLPVAGGDASALCYSPSNSIPVTGSLAASGILTLTSSDFAGNTLVVRGTYVAGSGGALPALANASLSITGPCGVAVRSSTIYQVPVLNGTYSGVASFGLNPRISMIPFTATFSQTVLNSYGTYNVTGTASFPSDPCVTGTLTTQAVNNIVAEGSDPYGRFIGNQFDLQFTDPVTQTTLFASGYTLDPANNQILLYLSLHNSTSAYSQCNDMGGATLILQP